MRKISLIIAITVMLANCGKPLYDEGYIETPRVSSVIVIDTPDGDNLIEASQGETWGKLSIKGDHLSYQNDYELPHVSIWPSGSYSNITCAIITATYEEIICKVENLNPGTYDLKVQVEDSDISNARMFTVY